MTEVAAILNFSHCIVDDINAKSKQMMNKLQRIGKMVNKWNQFLNQNWQQPPSKILFNGHIFVVLDVF